MTEPTRSDLPEPPPPDREVADHLGDIFSTVAARGPGAEPRYGQSSRAVRELIDELAEEAVAPAHGGDPPAEIMRQVASRPHHVEKVAHLRRNGALEEAAGLELVLSRCRAA